MRKQLDEHMPWSLSLAQTHCTCQGKKKALLSRCGGNISYAKVMLGPDTSCAGLWVQSYVYAFAKVGSTCVPAPARGCCVLAEVHLLCSFKSFIPGTIGHGIAMLETRVTTFVGRHASHARCHADRTRTCSGQVQTRV